MPAYTFHGLSDSDFEELSRDLLQEKLGIKLESFTRGKDSGIDLLNAFRKRRVIVQCKHYWSTGFKGLLRSMKRDELPKLHMLRPTRYVLCTSVGLTVSQKNQLKSVLQPYCRETADIVGREDLNALLRDYPRVEETHHKLWLTSVPVLQRILQSGMAIWKRLERDQLKRKLSLYVQTPAFEKALKILKRQRYCVISGIPGIGKTTLAQVLVTWFVHRDYELVVARDHVDQALERLDPDRKQIIYYDDFLGRSSIGERLGKNEDEGILRLLELAASSKNTRVILTTREYILEAAKQQFERLNGREIEIAKCILELENYTRAHRAKILYNHLFFSSLSRKHVINLIVHHSHRQIIDHENYSPRLIEWMTIGGGPKGVQTRRYASTFLSNLDYPHRIWKHAFEHQLKQSSRCLLHVLATMPDNTSLNGLEEAWLASMFNHIRTKPPGELNLRFRRALRHLDSTFIKTGRAEGDTTVEFHNPSIKDFVLRRIATNRKLVGELVEKSQYFEQTATLMQLGRDGQLSELSNGLIRDDQQLRAAIKRTISKQSPVLSSYQRMSLGRRFSLIASWSSNRRQLELLDFACVSLRQLIQAGLLQEASVDFVGFLNTVLSSEQLRKKHFDLIRKLTRQISGSLDETAESDDLESWGRFVDSWKDLLSFLDFGALGEVIRVHCQYEAKQTMSLCSSAEDVRFWAKELKRLALIWNVSIKDTLDELKCDAREKPRRRAYRDPPEPKLSSTAGAGTDGAIDRMFKTLLSRRRDTGSEKDRT